MKIGLFGYGKMGKMVEHEAVKQNFTIVEPHLADVCIDFSHADVALKHVHWAIENNIPLVIGTTGWDDRLNEAQKMVETSQIAVLASPNFSLGVAIFIELLKQARALLADYDLAGIEFHHREKKDNPSGTALAITNLLNMEHPFSSVRCGKIPGKHTLLFDSSNDTITISHEAHNRIGFAQGALKAASWIRDKKGWYTLEHMLRSSYGSHHAF